MDKQEKQRKRRKRRAFTAEFKAEAVRLCRGRRPHSSRRFERDLSPNTANTWLAVLRVVVSSAVNEIELDRNAMGLTKRITPRAMRRTFQDLVRAAEVSDVVTRAVSGHATEAMQRRYSTVSADEMRRSLGRVVSLAKFRQAHTAETQAPTSTQSTETGTSGVCIGVCMGGETKKPADQTRPTG